MGSDPSRPTSPTVEAGGLTPSSIARLLRPRAVAIVGASDDPRSIGGNVLANLKRAGFAGGLHLVSRTRAEIGGHRCVASIDDLPPELDAVVLNLPREAVLDAIAACGRRRANAAIVFASGFAEAGPDGRALQQRLAELALESQVLINGPNCLGFVNYVDGIPLTFGEYRPMPAKGAATGTAGVAVIAQSGAIANAIRDSLLACGLKVTFLVSTGNEAALGAEDFLEPILENEATGVIALFVEQVRQPRELLRLAARARDLGKRLVLMQPGRTQAARGAAQSHTGAVAGDLAIARTVLSHAGVAVVDGLDALVDVSLLLATRPLPSPGRTAVMTNSGAMRGLAFDFAQDAGLQLADWSPVTTAALQQLFPPFAATDNPLDLGTAAFAKPELMRRAAQLLLDDEAVSSLILPLFPGRPLQQVEKAEQLLPVIRASRKPVALVMLGDPMPLDTTCMAMMRAEGAALFRSTERAVRAMAAVNEIARNLAAPAPASAADGKPLDLDHLPAGAVAEHRAKALLARAGVPVPKGELAQDLPGAGVIAARIGFPVALKAQATSLPHKSDAGGVILDVGDPAALADAWERLHANIQRAKPGVALDGVLVEAMAPKIPGRVELIVGARRDPHWGGVLMLGLGGIWVETLQDVALLPANAGSAAITEALGRLKGAAILRGERGSPQVDVATVTDIARTLGDLLERSPDIAELEINPLLAYPEGKGALALDALIVKHAVPNTD
jgi:acetate---CoA ligase (ADP-forming)